MSGVSYVLYRTVLHLKVLKIRGLISLYFGFRYMNSGSLNRAATSLPRALLRINSVAQTMIQRDLEKNALEDQMSQPEFKSITL